jgi:hypothetical protein
VKFKAEDKLIDFSDVNIAKFSEAATYFKKHGAYPQDTDWWYMQRDRLLNGYTVDGVTITGEHYGYLNFCKIKLTEDKDKHKAKKLLYKKPKTKESTFPEFWDGDYIFYWVKYIARNGASDYPEVVNSGGLSLEQFNNLRFPDEVRIKPEKLKDETTGQEYTIYGGGKNLVVAKKRRFGASYKLGYSGCHRYNLYEKSTTLYAAYDMTYLTDDAIMSKCKETIDFMDKHTKFGRRRLINTDDHIKSGWKEKTDYGVEVEEGYLSQVIAVSFRMNKAAARGKDADEIFVDESGKAPNLLAFTDATMDTLGDGVYSTGQIIWFGTGGGDNTDWEGFKEIFFNPSKYKCLEFENVYDEGAAGTYCGFFIPDYWCVVGWMTDKGESLIKLAKEYEEEYQKLEFIDKGDTKGLVNRKMEHPFCPADAFAISSNNIFDIISIREWRKHVEANNLHKIMGTVGEFSYSAEGKLKFVMNESLHTYWEYPVKQDHNKNSAVVIWQPPAKDVDGKVHKNLYIVDVDSYRYEESTGDSVGAAYVYCRPSNLVSPNMDDRIVAQFVGRPKTKDEFCKAVFQMAEYYNAKIGFENDDMTLVDYAKRFRLLHMLEAEFELAYDEKLKTSNGKVNRKYGMHIGSGVLNERKLTGDDYIKDWLETRRTVSADGAVQLNLHTIYDIGLLKELEEYRHDKNADRIAAFRITRYHSRELVYKRLEARKESKKFAFMNHQFFK